MDKKLKQVTDTIHDTIYLSDLESQLISTPYFYRLHEVYQSSTVYMTFPSNRTKRYEHSLGVMDLTSQIFYSAIANASSEDRNALFDYLLTKTISIIKSFFAEEGTNVDYIKSNAGSLIAVMDWKENDNEDIDSDLGVKKLISDIVRNGYVEDNALQHYMVSFFNSSMSGKSDDCMITDSIAYSFVYQCTLQAMRVCALFHDVGHPPYSHIIENVLTKLLDESKSDWGDLKKNNKDIKEKIEQFEKCLDRYKMSEVDMYKNGLHFLLSFETELPFEKMQMHECVGMGMLLNAMELELKNIIEPLKRTVTQKDLGKLLYNIIVLEFTFAILLEKTEQFKALHKIIDGPFDADKLDYVVRDTINCGVDWGRVPYKRIIESAVLRKIEIDNQNLYVVTFPEKIADDIEDVLVIRYKIYIRINYHHRVAKTSAVLQNAVAQLARDYLLSNKNEELSPEIEYLWKSIQATNYSKELKIAKWSDSWLMSTLYDTLVKIRSDVKIKEIAKKQHKDIKKLMILRDLLEEVLLNKRHYHTLLKRKSDSMELLDDILERAEITDDLLDELVEFESDKLMNSSDLAEKTQARDSLFRIGIIKEAKKSGLFDLLSVALPHDIYEMLREILETDSDILDFYIVDNYGREKYGIEESAELWEEKIFLFDDNKVVEYNRVKELINQLKALHNTTVEKYCYVSVKEGVDTSKKIEEILEQVAVCCAESLKKRFIDNFPTFSKNHHLTTV